MKIKKIKKNIRQWITMARLGFTIAVSVAQQPFDIEYILKWSMWTLARKMNRKCHAHAEEAMKLLYIFAFGNGR